MTRSRDLANLADSTEFTSADHAKLDGIEASATADQTNAQIKTAVEAGADISLGGNPTTTTQSAGNNTTRVATTAFTQAAITALVGSVPATLNTLAELGDALGDDPNYATTTSNLIGTKMPLAGGAFTGAVTTNSTIDGVDIATRDGVLTNTTNTANAALPKAGGALTGVLTTNSSVGIGTSSPGSWSNAQNQLVVGDGSGDSGITIYSQNNANSNLRFSDGTTGSQQYSGRIEYDHVNDNLYLGAGGITPFIITTAGNVGIGIETPTSKLHVDGDLLSTGEIIALASTVDFSTTSSARDSNWIASFTNSGTTNPYGLYVDTTGAASTGYNLACYTNTGTGLFVKNDGNVGIGTTTPNAVAGYATLTLDGTSGSLLDFEVAGAITGELYATAATGMGMQAVGSRHIQFKTNNEERMRITSGGNVTVKTGNLVIGTSGKGIDFAAGAAGASTSNLLDEYEEGNCTIGMSDSGGNVITNTVGGGSLYTKIGKVVTVVGKVRTQASSDASGASGNFFLTGLPFTAQNATCIGHAVFNTHPSSGSYNAPAQYPRSSPVLPNGTAISVMKYSGSGGRSVNFQVSDLTMSGNSNFLFFTAVYNAAS